MKNEATEQHGTRTWVLDCQVRIFSNNLLLTASSVLSSKLIKPEELFLKKLFKWLTQNNEFSNGKHFHF